MKLFLVCVILLFPGVSIAVQVVDLGQLDLAPATPLSPSQPIELGSDQRRGIVAHAALLGEEQPAIDSTTLIQKGTTPFVLTLTFLSPKGEKLASGQAAVRIFSPESRRTETLRLKADPQGGWRTEVNLSETGETLFKVGTKLDDGKKRIFRFFFNSPQTKLPLGDEESTSGTQND